MRAKRGPLLVLLALVGVLVAAGIAYRALSAGAAPEVASEVPKSAQADGDALWLADHDATVYTDLGEPVLLTALADGKPLVINFWATWCPYCVDELPDFQQIVETYGDRVAFAFVDVADGERERASDAAAWLGEQGYADLPAYFDTDLAATTTFGAWSLPTTVVVSPEGEILTITAGQIDPVLLRGALETLV